MFFFVDIINKKINYCLVFLLFFSLACSVFFSEVLSLTPDAEGAQAFNASLSDLRGKLKEKFEKAAALSEENADEHEYKTLLIEVKRLKQEIAALEERLQPKNGDIVFFSADEFKKAVGILNKVRLALRDKFNLADPKKLALCWIIDFPMFEQDEASGKIDFAHNPFSMPIG